MRALTVTPGKADSLRLVDDAPEPPRDEGEVLVEAVAVGICGTDSEILAGDYGEPPAGRDDLVIGHESLGRVIEDPTGAMQPGDLVAGIVRHRDPVPCPYCAAGEWDLCSNGRYTECGIKGVDGFARQRWRVPSEYAVPLRPELGLAGVLLEPTSVVAKAWDNVDRIGARGFWAPQRVLVTGSGPIGLLAAMLSVQRGLETHVLARGKTGPKPELARRLGATYHTVPVAELDFDPDVIIECTGAPMVVHDVFGKLAPNGVACLTGINSKAHHIELDLNELNRCLVMKNNVIFGTVNANRRHWRQAADALARADHGWLMDMITHRYGLDDYAQAYAEQSGIKTVIEF
ncbi:glucose 1-dehydrogenase [Micromonospora sp. NBC_01813]|uniref:glucose 1-dehydrogenase n=1 Tax=Micromonospora sp. NBC_01813 TaxID=2975988 RepID=UPI002DDAD573|nr:glucose 1-dehydrogenase [Micromonospora sp. NBC_01813]WSA08150.1 glucose 1-dehydrogenase [Micromonospora sp. NBC_01813]